MNIYYVTTAATYATKGGINQRECCSPVNLATIVHALLWRKILVLKLRCFESQWELNRIKKAENKYWESEKTIRIEKAMEGDIHIYRHCMIQVYPVYVWHSFIGLGWGYSIVTRNRKFNEFLLLNEGKKKEIDTNSLFGHSQ